MMIVNVPIEPLDSRYTAQWYEWFHESLSSSVLSALSAGQYYHISVSPMSNKIREGEFLDVVGTVDYKARQVAKIAQLVDKGRIPRKGRVVFLLQDGWFPIEQLAYLRDLLGCYDWKFVGIFHDGTYDKWDLLGRKMLYTWGADLERSWFKIYDKIIVATRYHAHVLIEERQVPPHKILQLFWPIANLSQYICPKKDRLVVFPHRLAPEKQPDVFRALAQTFKRTQYKFLMTKELNLTKEAYYKLLGKAEIVVSTALLEMFGISMVEATILGCQPLVPDRLSYRELFPANYRYSDEAELDAKLRSMFHYGYRSPSSVSVSLRLACCHSKFFEALKTCLREV